MVETINLSSPLNSPKRSPLSSKFNLKTVLSNQIFLGLSVDMPFSFNSTFLIKYLVTVLPLTARFFICRSAKSKSHFSFFILPVFFSKIETISASPLGFAEK